MYYVRYSSAYRLVHLCAHMNQVLVWNPTVNWFSQFSSIPKGTSRGHFRLLFFVTITISNGILFVPCLTTLILIQIYFICSQQLRASLLQQWGKEHGATTYNVQCSQFKCINLLELPTFNWEAVSSLQELDVTPHLGVISSGVFKNIDLKASGFCKIIQINMYNFPKKQKKSLIKHQNVV